MAFRGRPTSFNRVLPKLCIDECCWDASAILGTLNEIGRKDRAVPARINVYNLRNLGLFFEGRIYEKL